MTSPPPKNPDAPTLLLAAVVPEELREALSALRPDWSAEQAGTHGRWSALLLPRRAGRGLGRALSARLGKAAVGRVEGAHAADLHVAGRLVASFEACDGPRPLGHGQLAALLPWLAPPADAALVRELVEWTDETPDSGAVAFDPTRSRRARAERSERRAEAATRLATEIRAAMDAEMAARLRWMRRHAQALGLSISPAAEPSRELERALMARAGAALRERAAEPDVHAAQLELDALKAQERQRFHRFATRHAEIHGGSAPPPLAEAPDEPWFARAAERLLPPVGADVRPALARLLGWAGPA